MKNQNYHAVRTILKSNIKIVERGKFYTLYKKIQKYNIKSAKKCPYKLHIWQFFEWIEMIFNLIDVSILTSLNLWYLQNFMKSLNARATSGSGTTNTNTPVPMEYVPIVTNVPRSLPDM